MSCPRIILVKSQMGENIGASARAMLNCGLDSLSLVAPRDGWPSPAAEAMSSGALEKMPPVNVYENVASAIEDDHYVYATTARTRDMAKPVLTAQEAGKNMAQRIESGQKISVLFGAERAGLDNEDVALANAIITIPLNPGFSSLNLAQGVLLIAYEWRQHAQSITPQESHHVPAAHKDFQDLIQRLEEELERASFFRSPDMKPTILRNLKNMLSRSEMTDQEVRTFHGIISALLGKKKN